MRQIKQGLNQPQLVKSAEIYWNDKHKMWTATLEECGQEWAVHDIGKVIREERSSRCRMTEIYRRTVWYKKT
jgi:hypothetical protein